MNKKVEVKNEEQTDGFRLGVYVMAIRGKFPEVRQYEEQVRLLHEEFGICVTERQLWALDEPTWAEEELDLRLMYENVI